MKISREALAKELGVEPNTLFRWEKNHREPSDNVKWKISEILDVNIAWLMGAGDDDGEGGDVMKMNRLINLRKSRKMTQEEMAKAVGVSSRTYASWEAGASEMRAGGLRKISEVLGIPMESIFNDSPETPALRALPPSPSAPPPSEREAKTSCSCALSSASLLEGGARRAEGGRNIEIEIELPSRSKVRFSIPADTDEDKIGKLIMNITGGSPQKPPALPLPEAHYKEYSQATPKDLQE